ncbi:G protein linked acetylcholine receptor [Trichuris trichiura]|uniref:G protein linked acetylcholine receptor n=1 Tax=Trichuris trichiura TaxID=36087 RepID=A0A077Z9G3_TRITR|nr:G protein linked acetylcholine receptor [Trichuris trichiura]
MSDDTAYAEPYPLGLVIFLWLLTILFSVETILGNLLVLVAYRIERTIRMQLSSHFIVSLAVSDLIIGMEGFPLLTLYVVGREHWPLGQLVCKIWLCLDYTLCLVSIFTVLLITVDRYLSVCYPAKYRHWQSLSKVQALVTASWLIPTMLFGIMIFGWNYFTNTTSPPTNKCYAPFLNDPFVNMSLYIAYYWTILIAMSVLYRGIHLAAKQLEERNAARHHRTVALMLGQRCVAQVSVGLYFHADSEIARTAAVKKAPSLSIKLSKNRGKRSLPMAPNIVVTGSPKGGSRLVRARSSQYASRWPVSEGRSSCPLLYSKSESDQKELTRVHSARDSLEGYDPFNFINDCPPNDLKSSPSLQHSKSADIKGSMHLGVDGADVSCASSCSVESKDKMEPNGEEKTDRSHSSDRSETGSSTRGSFDSRPSQTSCAKRKGVNGLLLAATTVSAPALHGKSTKSPTKIMDKSATSPKLARWTSILFSNPASLLMRKRKVTKAEKRARRAFRTITVIVGAFALFWSPYYIVATIYGFCQDCVPNALFLTSYYLCYLNSSFNPFAYAFANRAFRRAFLRVLKGDLRRT